MYILCNAAFGLALHSFTKYPLQSTLALKSKAKAQFNPKCLLIANVYRCVRCIYSIPFSRNIVSIQARLPKRDCIFPALFINTNVGV